MKYYNLIFAVWPLQLLINNPVFFIIMIISSVDWSLVHTYRILECRLMLIFKMSPLIVIISPYRILFAKLSMFNVRIRSHDS